MCRETIVYHVNSINYLYTPLCVASVFVVHYVMKICFAGYELYLYASFEDVYEREWMAARQCEWQCFSHSGLKS